MNNKILILGCTALAAINLTAATFYVRQGGTGDGSSWENASGDFQRTLDTAAAVSGEGNPQDIWVSEGQYPPIVIKGNVNVYGGFPTAGSNSLDDRIPNIYKSIINGDTNGNDYDFDNDGFPEAFRNDNATRVVEKRTTYDFYIEPDVPPFAVAYSTVFDGFHIRGGKYGIFSTIDDDVYSSLQNLVLEYNELGVLLSNVSLRNSIIRHNQIAGNLSGVSLYDCVITSNSPPQGKAVLRFEEPGGAFGAIGTNRISGCFIVNNTPSEGLSVDYFSHFNHRSSYSMTRCLVTDGTVRNALSINNSTLVHDPTYSRSDYSRQQSISRSIIGNKLYTTIDSFVTTDPLFVNPNDPKGPDGLFGSVDDGFMLQASSPARQGVPPNNWVYGAYEFQVSPIYDLDADGMFDNWEQIIIDANPNDSLTSIHQVLPDEDFDLDGISNLEEYLNRTSPLEPDSDFDGYTDKEELEAGKDPNDRLSQPINLRPLTAVELRFFGTPGMSYQAQQLLDGETWKNVSDPMDGEGKEQFILFSYEGARLDSALYRIVETSQP